MHDPQRDKTVLIVEDDEDIGLFLVQCIDYETSFHALLFTNGYDALQALRTIQPCLFVLDYNLPGMNGIELYDHIQCLEAGEDIPAIMISATLPRREIAQRHLVGMRKPFDLSFFLQAIESLIA